MGYSSRADVRLLTRTVIEEVLTDQSGTQIRTNYPIVQTSTGYVNSVYKNETELTGTSSSTPADDYYNARRPNYIVVNSTTTISATDYITVNYNTKITNAQIDDAILDADNYINNRLNPLYTVPFSTDDNGEYPPEIVRASKYLAASYILEILYIGEQPNITNLKSDYVRRAETAIEAISSGKVTLLDSTGAAVSRGGVMTSTTDGEEPIFNMGDDDTWGDDFKENDFDSQ